MAKKSERMPSASYLANPSLGSKLHQLQKIKSYPAGNCYDLTISLYWSKYVRVACITFGANISVEIIVGIAMRAKAPSMRPIAASKETTAATTISAT